MENTVILQEETLVNKIYFIRGVKVMLDFDLAYLYEIETRALKQQVRRNRERFPDDFMFELNSGDIDLLVSQNVIPSRSFLGGSQLMRFTELGVAMLSSILRSKKAVIVNIAIMRTFVYLRRLLNSNQELAGRIDALEATYDRQFNEVFAAIRELIIVKNEPREKIGYKIPGSKD